MASERRLSRSRTPEKLREMTPETEKKNLQWQGPTKETKSSRQRREMNAGKGIRNRSLSSENSMEDLSKDASEWLRNKLLEQKKTIAKLECDAVDLRKENDTLKGRLSDQESQNMELENRVKEYENIIDAEAKLMVNNEAEMKRLKTRVLLLEEQLKKTTKEKEEQHGIVKSFEQKQQSIEKELQEKTGKLGEKNAESDNFQKEILNCKQQNNELENNVGKLYGVIESQTSEMNLLKSELEQSKERQLALQEEKTKAEETCNKYESELTERIKENLSMMDDLDQVKMHDSQKNLKINELLKVIELGKMELRNKQNENEDLMKSRERLEKTITSEVEAKKEFEAQSRNQKGNIKNLEDLLANTSQSLNEKTDIIENFLSENANLRDKLVEATNVCEELTKEINETKKLRAAENTNHTNEMKQSGDEMEEMRGEVEDLRNKCDLLEKECDAERHACVESKKENEKSQQQISELKENILHSVKGMNEKTSVLNNLLSENSALKEKLKQSETACDHVKLQSEEMRTEFQNKASEDLQQIEELQTALEVLISENNEQIDSISVMRQNLDKQDKQIKQQDESSIKLEKEFDEHKKTKELERDVQLGQIKALQQAVEEKCQDISNKDSMIANLEDAVKRLEDTNFLNEKKLNKLALENQNLTERAKKMTDLKLKTQKQEQISDELKMKLGQAAEKHQLEAENLNKKHEEGVKKLQEELDLSMEKNKEEITELLNNFSELENELTFCQEELNSKVKENAQLREEVEEVSTHHLMKEQKLLEDLQALNEQNENILQNEIEKFKNENEEAVTRLTQQNLNEITKLENEFQGKVECLKKLHEREKGQESEELKNKYDKKISVLEAGKDKAETNFHQKNETHEREIQNSQRQMKMKTAEVESKTRINEKLRKRIETQQKLIDYLMKSLDQERSKRGESSRSIMNALSRIQLQLDEKFITPPEINQQLSPIQTRQHSSHTSLMSNSELELLPATSNRDLNENFVPWSASSPVRKVLSTTAPSLGIGDSASRLNAIEGSSYLSQSLPESSMKDLGYHSPSHETSTLSFYFAEQIKAISSTFDKIEFLDSTNVPAEKLNVEIWKQKIHFRLKVLDEQLNEVEEEVSDFPNKTTTEKQLKENGSCVTYRPGNDEIRTLIDNVNRKYQELHSKYIPRSNSR